MNDNSTDTLHLDRNEVVITGLVSATPEHRTTGAGTTAVTLPVTVRTGQPRTTDVIPVTVVNPDDDVRGATRGTAVTVRGNLYRRHRPYYASNGTVSRVELVADIVSVDKRVGDCSDLDGSADRNEATLVGALAARPEFRTFGEGATMARLLVTVQPVGSWRRHVIPVTVWEPEPALLGTQRGAPITVTGRVHRRFGTGGDGRAPQLEVVADTFKVGTAVPV